MNAMKVYKIDESQKHKNDVKDITDLISVAMTRWQNLKVEHRDNFEINKILRYNNMIRDFVIDPQNKSRARSRDQSVILVSVNICVFMACLSINCAITNSARKEPIPRITVVSPHQNTLFIATGTN